MKHFAAVLLLATAVFTTSGCSSIAEAMIESALGGSKKDRRAKQYEKRGYSPERASRLAFEDEVWGDL